MLRRPVLVAAFRGWNDGGAGRDARRRLPRAGSGARERFAEIDPEELLRLPGDAPARLARRGLTRQIDWPENAFYHAPMPGLDRDAVLLLGIEPNLRWRTFTGLIVGLAPRPRRRARGHARRAARRRAAHAARAGDRARDRSGAGRASSGSSVALRGADRDRRRPPRRVPSRGAAVGQPLGGRAALRLARAEPARRAGALSSGSARCSATEIDARSSRRRRAAYAEQVSEAVSSDEETAAYVEELERRADKIDEELDLPSGDTLAAELTRFLRERDREERPRRRPSRPVAPHLAEREGVGLDARARSGARAVRPALPGAAQRVEPVAA